MSLLWVYSGSPTTDQTVFHVSSLEEISSSAMAAAFEDIFNNSDHQFVDICPVIESDDSGIRNVPLVCARVSPILLFKNYLFFRKKFKLVVSVGRRPR